MEKWRKENRFLQISWITRKVLRRRRIMIRSVTLWRCFLFFLLRLLLFLDDRMIEWYQQKSVPSRDAAQQVFVRGTYKRATTNLQQAVASYCCRPIVANCNMQLNLIIQLILLRTIQVLLCSSYWSWVRSPSFKWWSNLTNDHESAEQSVHLLLW